MFNLTGNTPSITPEDASKKILNDKVAFIDVRSEAEYRGGHAQKAKNIPLETLEGHVESLKNFPEVYVICQSGGRSARAVDFLLTQNVNAFNVSGGTSTWQYAGLPME
jgi:rhodanese-related sulfurtransferase